MPRFAANVSFMFQEDPFLDRFAAAAGQGFQAVEFTFPYDFSPAAVAAAVRDAGLQVVLFNSPPGDYAAGERGLAALPARRQDFRASMMRAFDYAEALSCPRIHVIAGVEPAGTDRKALRACFLDNLAWAAEQASGLGLTLMLEPINRRDIPGFYLYDYDEAERIIGEIGAPNLRLQFDFYHAQITHGDVIKRFERQLPCSSHIQIANPPDRRGPGRGELDYRFIFAQIDALGYDGWVSCEYRPGDEGTVASLDWIREYGIRPR